MDRRSVKMAENKKVVITLVKSPIGGKENQKATLKALGLNKMHASVEKYETETIKGMINAVRHLVKVEYK
ncbi:ribosomal protein L30 [Catenibacterium mitsuokai DSM 15897]|jgi:large subunit ribosomal protein L30|nr:ribosomal protein L30 [Catenibacterium mitsuokai DSM 15897]MBT9814179.1 50S ribosomal protein L30 [Catenibacterium mitsuokai]